MNEAADQYFVGNAQILRKLEALETALKNNAKIVVPSNNELINVIGDMAGVLPVNHKPEKTAEAWVLLALLKVIGTGIDRVVQLCQSLRRWR